MASRRCSAALSAFCTRVKEAEEPFFDFGAIYRCRRCRDLVMAVWLYGMLDDSMICEWLISCANLPVPSLFAYKLV